MEEIVFVKAVICEQMTSKMAGLRALVEGPRELVLQYLAEHYPRNPITEITRTGEYTHCIGEIVLVPHQAKPRMVERC